MTIFLSPYVLGMGNSALFPSDESSGLHWVPITVTCKGFSFLLLGILVISFKMRKLANVSHYLSYSLKKIFLLFFVGVFLLFLFFTI